MNQKPALVLENFFPYQLTKLQVLVSDRIAQIYTGEFNLSRQEWRVLAILANNQSLSAKQIGRLANLEKMPTSRAIQKMQEKGLLKKAENISDKRSSLLMLTNEGQNLFNELEPMVLDREKELLALLNEDEKRAIHSLIDKLSQITN